MESTGVFNEKQYMERIDKLEKKLENMSTYDHEDYCKERIDKMEKMSTHDEKDDCKVRIEKLEKNMESMATHEHKDDPVNTYIFTPMSWIFSIIFTSIAIYWLYLGIVRYNSEPVSSTVSIKRNTTFTWPAITVCPAKTCFNLTAIQQLSEDLNLTLGYLPTLKDYLKDYKESYLKLHQGVTFNYTVRDYPPYMEPFDLQKSHFEWSKYKYSDILSKVRCTDRRSLIKRCKYWQYAFVNIGEHATAHGYFDCLAAESSNGKWISYPTMYSPCHTFIAKPATNLYNYITITLDHSMMYGYYIGLNTAHSKYYRLNTPTTKTYWLKGGQSHEITLQLQEYTSMNRKVSRCIDHKRHNQVECYQEKDKDYLIRNSGCYFPVITGYPSLGSYPECNNLSQYTTFMKLHARVFNSERYPIEELEEDKKSCYPACNTHMYIANDYIKKSIRKKNISQVKFRLSKDAMYYLHVQENFDMTTDDLVANVGGTVGIFLGISCLTFLTFIKYVVKLLRNIASS